MNKQNWLRRVLSMALLACLAFTLCACPGGAPVTPPDGSCTHEGGEATCTAKAICTKCGEAYGTVAAHIFVDGTCIGCGAKDGSGAPVPDTYVDGAPVAGGGATLPEGSTCLTATTYDESTAEGIKAVSFFRNVDRQPGKVYRITDDKALKIGGAAGTYYDGNGAILIAPQGVVIEGSRDVSLANLVIVGSVTISGSSDVTLEKVEIISTETALTIDNTSTLFKMNDCRLTGKTALALGADDSVVLNSYFAFTEKGIVDTAATGTTIRNCVLEGTGEGIRTTASECTYRSNTVIMTAADTGIILDAGILNGLVALNDITGAQKSIVVGGVKNVSVVLNRGVSVEANGNTNLYICDNSLGGRLTVNNNDYFLCDGNTFPADEWNHATVQTGNTNHNGNNLMDVNARPEVGADEALLPHLDKDLFVGMDLKDLVRDVMEEENVAISAYILAHCKTDDYVIIAPGAYKTDSRSEEHTSESSHAT